MMSQQVGIVGGGLMGLALARKLTLDGHAVTVLEQSNQLGGLATWHDYEGVIWDRFYHVILPTDVHLLSLIRDLGLESELLWNRTRTGFYVDSQMHSISSNMEFLRFPLLSLVSKARLAWTMLYGSRLDDWRQLEKVSAVEWLTRVSGTQTYQKLWRPLLLAKLGNNFDRVSAVFIWAYIKRMFSARDSSASAEHLGHVKGGYHQLFSNLVDQIEACGGVIESGKTVSSLTAAGDAGINVVVDGEDRKFDKVICTSPVSVLRKIADPRLMQYSGSDEDVEYLGVACVVLITKKPIVPFYVVNIADPDIPFTGIIGLSNVIPPEHTNGRHITYLPKYILSTDEELRRDDEYFETTFVEALVSMIPTIETSDIESVHVNRAIKVQPLQVLKYSELAPQVGTLHPDLFTLNTSQFVNATLNNNEVVGAVNRFHAKYARQLAA